MKVLNLYAGIGGNRKLWTDCEVTAVENNPEIAAIYQDFFPDDTVVIADAHQYLLDHYKEFDFIWSSPPCPSHSKINTDGNHAARYPDMKLYEEVIMLSNNWYNGKWVVENVIPYYTPLIKAKEIGRHLFWCNFKMPQIKLKKEKAIAYQTGTNGRYGFNLKGVSVKHDKRQILRNLIDPELGLHIFNCALERIDKNTYSQKELF